MSITVRAQQHDTLDLLCWRHGCRTMLEATLALNRRLSDVDAILPHGTLVILPEPVTSLAHSVQLWE